MRPELQALFTELYMAYYQKEQAKRAKNAGETNGAAAAGGASPSGADQKGNPPS
jgi:hypothetical protein